jgi:hypothetical protein
MSGHARLAPSSAPIWGPDGCPASVTLQERYPENEETPKAREGTAAHHYATETLGGRAVAVGQLAPNGHPVDRDMVDCAVDFVRDVHDTLKSWGNGKLMIESRVFAHNTVHPLNDGTPDAYLIERMRKLLHVWDYKYGHRYVDAYMNWQMIDYAIAALETEGVPREEWGQWTITLTIAQPRNYHPDGPLREWHLNGAALSELADKLRVAAFAALDPNAPYKTGPHCRDCTGRHACPALERVAMREVDMSMTGQPVDLPPAALGLELRIIRDAMKRLGARAEGLEEHALAMARAGTDVPHWRAEYSKGRERWNDTTGPAELTALGEIYDVNLLQPPKGITPTQARKAGLDHDLIKTFSITPRGPMALVPFDDADVAKRFS